MTNDPARDRQVASTATLTSLAILKVNVDQGKDYLDYLRPFVLQVLVERKPDPITNGVVSGYIGEKFGLVIPERTVEIVLKRISRNHAIEHTSIDSVANQRQLDDWYSRVVGGLDQVIQDCVDCRFTVTSQGQVRPPRLKHVRKLS